MATLMTLMGQLGIDASAWSSGIQKAVTDMDTLSSRVDSGAGAISETMSKATESSNQVAESLTKTGTAAQEAGKGVSSFGEGFNTIMKVAKPIAELEAVRQGFLKWMDMGEQGGGLWNVKDRFDELAVQAGTTGGVMADSFENATNGVVGLDDAMAQFNRTMNMTSGGLSDQFANMILLARAVAVNVPNLTPEGALTQISGAVGRAQGRPLQEVGIKIDQQQALEDYAAAHGELASAMSLSEQQAATWQATMDAADKSLPGWRDGITGAADGVLRLKVQLDDVGQTAAMIASPGINSLSDAMATVMSVAGPVGQEIANLSRELNTLQTARSGVAGFIGDIQNLAMGSRLAGGPIAGWGVALEQSARLVGTAIGNWIVPPKVQTDIESTGNAALVAAAQVDAIGIALGNLHSKTITISIATQMMGMGVEGETGDYNYTKQLPTIKPLPSPTVLGRTQSELTARSEWVGQIQDAALAANHWGKETDNASYAATNANEELRAFQASLVDAGSGAGGAMSDATKAADDLTASFKAMLGPTEDYTGMANAKLAALGQRPDATDEPLRRVAALMNDTMGTLKQSYAGDTLAQLGLTGTEDQATMQARAANYLLGPRQMGDYNMDAINKQLGDQTSSAAAMDAIIAQIGGQVALGNSAVISTAGGAAANPLGMDGAGLGTGLGTTMGTSAIDTFKGLGWQAAGIFVVGEIAKGAKSSDSGLLEAIAGPLYPYIKKRLHDEGELTY